MNESISFPRPSYLCYTMICCEAVSQVCLVVVDHRHGRISSLDLSFSFQINLMDLTFSLLHPSLVSV